MDKKKTDEYAAATAVTEQTPAAAQPVIQPQYKTNLEVADAIANGTLTGKGVTDAYGRMAAGKMDEINAMGSFKYDFNKDPMFKILSNSYMEQARQAANNASAMAAARTGGYGNSYGAAAAGAQYNTALGRLYDQVPELQEAAYQRYLNDRNDMYKQASYYTDRGDTAWNQNYQQSEADREQSNWDKQFEYKQTSDAYDRQTSAAQYLASLGNYEAVEKLYGADLSDARQADALNRALAIVNATGMTGYEATAFIQQYIGDPDNALSYGYSGDYGTGGSGSGGSGKGRSGSGSGSGTGGSGSGSAEDRTISFTTIPIADELWNTIQALQKRK